MHSLRCGDVTFNEHCLIDEPPQFTLRNDYWSLFPLLRPNLSHTHTVASVWSTLTTNVLRTALEKKNHSHLGFLHYPHHLILVAISAWRQRGNHREAEGSTLSVLRARHTHIHNNQLWKQCVGWADNAWPRPSVLPAWYWHSWSQWWMGHLTTSDTTFSHFQGKQYRCLKMMNTVKWRDGKKHFLHKRN